MSPTVSFDDRIIDLEPSADNFLEESLRGLAEKPKVFSCKFLYDEKGSKLFDRICELEEYYPTRTELSIFKRHLPEIAECVGPEARVIEFGSGSSMKTYWLLDALDRPRGYIPIEISREHMLDACQSLAERYPALEITPICADYTQSIRIPNGESESGRRVIFFPGSTIGNFHPGDASVFLRRMANMVRSGDCLLIGVDLEKDPRILEAAYNDREGVTAAFNRNLLERMNRELGADIDLDKFVHKAVYNREESRVEMHLVSLADQSVSLGGIVFPVEKHESIRTEVSYKYTPERFESLASKAGWRRAQLFVDRKNLFSVQLFEKMKQTD